MFAVLAAVAFLLALFKVAIGEVNLVTLGLFLLACHLVYAWTPWVDHRGRTGARG